MVVAYIKEEFKISRIVAVVISLSVVTVFGVFCSLSQGALSDIKIFGSNIFDFFDNISANVFMPIGGLLAVIFVGWKMTKADYTDEITSGGTIPLRPFFMNLTRLIIKYVAPIIIAIIMIRGWM